MADPTYTNVTTVMDVKVLLNDTGMTDNKSLLTTKKYLQFILKRIIGESTTWTISEIQTNYFKYLAGGLYLFIPSATVGIFTGQDDLTYETTPDATIYVSAGENHTEGDITVTAARIDKAELMVDLYHFLAGHRAKEVAQSIGDGTIDPSDAAERCIAMANRWRGVR